MKILNVVGARPNLMKIAPILRALRSHPVEAILVHTGQHYSDAMSGSFFRQLDIPPPTVDLGVGSGSHAWQTAEIMRRFEPEVEKLTPDVIVVVGDVNSTLAAALVGAKLNVPVAHVEAGLRSGDMTMPEEINRRVTDVVSSLLFTPSADADDNLHAEGIDKDKIHMVGNVMVDSLLHLQAQADASAIREELSLQTGSFALVTLHRPSNVDDDASLREVVEPLLWLSERMPVVFPVHPRTSEALQRSGGHDKLIASGVHLLPPLPYLEFIGLLGDAAAVLTDSGGIQEEASVLGVRCFTLRDNTERPITVSQGTNVIAGTKAPDIIATLEDGLARSREIPTPPPLWDGRAAERIAEVLLSFDGN